MKPEVQFFRKYSTPGLRSLGCNVLVRRVDLGSELLGSAQGPSRAMLVFLP